MPPITSTFEAFSSGQRHSRCVYSVRKKTKLTRSPISNLRGDLGGSCGDREVLNLLQNLLLLPLLTCWLVGLEVKARMGILSLKMKKTKGLASYCRAKTTFTFYFSILTLSNAFLGIDNREMKSESGFSFAIASQPL